MGPFASALLLIYLFASLLSMTIWHVPSSQPSRAISPAYATAVRITYALEYYLKWSHLIILIVFNSIFGATVALLLRLLPSKHPRSYDACYYANRLFYHSASYILRLNVNVIPHPSVDLDAAEFTKPFLIVSNHQATIDIIILGSFFPRRCTFLAKKSLGNIPFLGQYFRAAKVVMIDRSNLKASIDMLDSAAKEIQKNKLSIAVYPEGTRSHATDGTLLPFKKGVFHLAVKAGLDVLPVIVSSYKDIYQSNQPMFPGGDITVKVLEPIPCGTDYNILMEKTRASMQSEMYKLVGQEKVDNDVKRE